MIQLKQLFKGIVAELPHDSDHVDINYIQYDSRKLQSGDLFIAIKGFQSDGHDFLQQAKEKNVAAAVVEEIRDIPGLLQIKVNDCRIVMSRLAYNFYKEYLEKMILVGITGTNGKTTTSYLVKSILDTAGISCGLVGTIHYVVGNNLIDAWNTTPESVDLYAMIAEMQKNGNKACVLEVSSHALALHRVLGLKFDAAVFTNLSRDHMDFHESMGAYFKEKSRLFEQLSEKGTAVINHDDAYGKKLIGTAGNGFTFGNEKVCDLYCENSETTADGTKLRLKISGTVVEIHSKLIGDFNTSNIMAAAGVGAALGLDYNLIKEGIENLKAVPGRLEAHKLTSGGLAVIDYAHTPDALEKALTTVRKITAQKLIVVFGCGGDRDRGKRPEMGRVAQKYADIIFITDDNPRTENPKLIINEIISGIIMNDNIHIIYNRRDAVTKAVQSAGRGDVVLIAGKGHEKYQIIGKVKHNFDEVLIIREAEQNA